MGSLSLGIGTKLIIRGDVGIMDGMKLRPVAIAGLGAYVPEKVLTNADLEKMVDTSDEWITTRTGIKERRVADDSMVTSDLALAASQRALEDAGITPQDLDLIVVARVLPDMPFPSTACFLQAKLGAERAAAVDVVAGCTGWVYGTVLAAPMVASGLYNTVLVVGAELLSRILDWTDRNTCVLLGDGAGAAVLRPALSGRGILSTYLAADGTAADLLTMPGGGSLHPASHETIDQRLHYFKMQGRETFKRAGAIMVDACLRVLEKAGVSLEDVDLLVPHQANLRIIQSMVKRLEIPEEKVMINIHRYGNISAASIPVALTEARQAGRLKDGDLVLVVSFGTGLTWGAMLIKWGK